MSENRASGYGSGSPKITLAPVPFDTNKALGIGDYAYNLGQMAYEVPSFQWVIYSGNATWQNLPITVNATRDPTSADNTYGIGTTWANTTSNTLWGLTSFASPGVAQWTDLTADVTGSVVSLKGNDLLQVLPDGNGNINVLGGTSGFLRTSRTATNTLTVQESGILRPPNGGTGLNSVSAYSTIVAGSTNTGTFQDSGAPGVSGTVWTSNGPTSVPSWQANGNVSGPGTSTNRAISTWNGTNGNLLFDNPGVVVSSTGSIATVQSLSGSSLSLTVDNSSNTASSNAIVSIAVAGTSSGDPFTQWSVGSAQAYAFGISNSNSQSLRITSASSSSVTPSTGATIFGLESGGIVFVGDGTHIIAEAPNLIRFQLTASAPSQVVTQAILNADNTSTTSHAQLNIYAGGSSGGCPSIYFDAGTSGWDIGIANSVTGQPFRLVYGVASNPLTGAVVLQAATNGSVTLGTNTSSVLGVNNTVATTVGVAGGASPLPALPTGYLEVTINGTLQKIPYYAV